MTPDRAPKRHQKKKLKVETTETSNLTRHSSDDEHEIVYFQRNLDEDFENSIPGQNFLNKICPEKVRRTMRAVLIAVAKAPPKSFAGGGYWEAMHGEMTGWFEVRVDGPGRTHYRLYCLLDYDHPLESKPLLVIITGLRKLYKSKFSELDYAKVRELGKEYKSRRLEKTD